MALGQALHLVGEDHGYVEGVARAPDAAFTVNEALQSLGNRLSAHVEPAHGFFLAVGEAEVARRPALAGEEDEGFAGDLDFGEALSVGFGRSDTLELVVIGFQFHPCIGLGAPDIGNRRPEGVAVSILGKETQVGGKQVHRREPAGYHIVSRGFGIVPVFPFVVIPVGEVVPPVALLHVPYGVLLFGGFPALDRDHLRRFLAAVQGVFLPEGQEDAVDGPRLLLEQAGQVDAEGIPFVQVPGAVFRQGDLPAVHQASRPAEVGGTAEVVLLQEQEHIVLIDLDNPQVHGRQVHGVEGEDEAAVVRKDVPVDGNGYRGRRVDGGELRAEILRKILSISTLYPTVDSQGQVAGISFEIHPCAVVPDVHGLPDGAVEFDEAFPGRGGRERFAEPDFHTGVAAPDDPGVDNLEGAGGRDDGLEFRLVAEAVDLQMELDIPVGLGTGDRCGLEPVQAPLAGKGDGCLGIHGQGDVLHRGRNAQADGSFQNGVIPDGDALQGQGSRLGGDLDAERELLAVIFLDRKHFAHVESTFVHGSGFPGVGHELDYGRAQPPLGSGQGGPEGEQAVGLAVHRHRGRQFDAEGRPFGDDTSRIGLDISGKGWIRVRTRPLGTARREDGEKGCKAPETETAHDAILLIQRYEKI